MKDFKDIIWIEGEPHYEDCSINKNGNCDCGISIEESLIFKIKAESKAMRFFDKTVTDSYSTYAAALNSRNKAQLEIEALKTELLKLLES